MAQITHVFEKLLEHTSQGKVNWQKRGPDSFSVVIGELSVSISLYISKPNDSFLQDNADVILRITNKEGRQIDHTTTEDNEVASYKLRELFTRAKRFALGTDRLLEELMEELDKV